jgi:hypothetical protein
MITAAIAVLAIAAAPFAFRWSRTCEEEAARATTAWRAYADGLSEGAARSRARAIEGRIAADPAGALEDAESLGAIPPPDDRASAARYREAMETLVLAEGACAR